MINYCVLRKKDYEEDERYLLQRKLLSPIYCIACSLHIEGWPWRMSAAWWGEEGRTSCLAGRSHVGRQEHLCEETAKYWSVTKVSNYQKISRMNDEYDKKFSKDLPYNTVHQLSLKSYKGKRTVWAFWLQTGALRSITDVLYH